MEEIATIIWDYAQVCWNFQIFEVDQSSITIGKVFQAGFLILLGFVVSRWLARRLVARMLSGLKLRIGVVDAIRTMSFYTLFALFVLLALSIVHIPLTIFTLVGGAVAIGVGFGSQNVVRNFISGLILLIEQPVRSGDIIEFEDLRGTIKRIGARSTVLLTPENLEVIVPNSSLLEQRVTNWTLESNKVRRELVVGVAYGSPTKEVADALLKVADEHGRVLKDPKPEVFFTDFGDSALTFMLRFWVKLESVTEALRIESDLRYMIDSAFRSADVVIAFPQRDVHLDAKEPLQVQLRPLEGNSSP